MKTSSFNGSTKRPIHTATYKHATFHVITAHSAIPKKTQPKQNYQTLHTSTKPNIKLIKTKTKWEPWVSVMSKKQTKREEKKIKENKLRRKKRDPTATSVGDAAEKHRQRWCVGGK